MLKNILNSLFSSDDKEKNNVLEDSVNESVKNILDAKIFEKKRLKLLNEAFSDEKPENREIFKNNFLKTINHIKESNKKILIIPYIERKRVIKDLFGDIDGFKTTDSKEESNKILDNSNIDIVLTDINVFRGRENKDIYELIRKEFIYRHGGYYPLSKYFSDHRTEFMRIMEIAKKNNDLYIPKEEKPSELENNLYYLTHSIAHDSYASFGGYHFFKEIKDKVEHSLLLLPDRSIYSLFSEYYLDYNERPGMKLVQKEGYKSVIYALLQISEDLGVENLEPEYKEPRDPGDPFSFIGNKY